MKRIPLRARNGSVRAYALVDDADFEWLSQWRWCLGLKKNDRPDHIGYAHRRRLGGGGYELMHRAIMRAPHGIEVDHEDGNSLNNQRSNLRLATRSQNAQNQRTFATNKSGHRGVSWHRRAGKWQVHVVADGQRHYLGLFTDPDEAGRVAADFRREHLPFSKEARNAA